VPETRAAGAYPNLGESAHAVVLPNGPRGAVGFGSPGASSHVLPRRAADDPARRGRARVLVGVSCAFAKLQVVALRGVGAGRGRTGRLRPAAGGAAAMLISRRVLGGRGRWPFQVTLLSFHIENFVPFA
jgi:hypothetical protein